MQLITTPTHSQLLILGAESLFNKTNMSKIIRYVEPTKSASPTIASIFLPAKGKIKRTEFDKESEEIINYCETFGIKTIAITTADYYKFMSGRKTFEGDVGTAKKGVGVYEGYTIIPVLNLNIVSKYPQKSKMFLQSIRTVKAVLDGDYTEDSYKRPEVSKVITEPKDAVTELKKIIDSPILACDIETTGLNWYNDDVLTLSLATSEEYTVCFAVHEKYSGSAMTAKNMRKVLRKFFESFKGKLVLHNGAFDIPFIVHSIMREKDFSIDYIPLVNLFDLEDTMLMAYILYNSTERPQVGLKPLSKARYGEYDEDIDQRYLFQAPLSKVAEYNNIDVAATMYLYDKFYNNELTAEGLMEVYVENYKRLMKFIIKMKMEGLRIDKDLTKKYAEDLSKMIKKDNETLRSLPAVREARSIIVDEMVDKRNASLKTKQVSAEDAEFADVVFNPNSANHKRVLLFEVLDFPVDKLTESGAPSVDAEVMGNMLDYADTEEKKEILTLLKEIALAEKVVNTYLTGFRDFNTEVSKGDYRIFGDFLLHGTVSGRLSSRNPNLNVGLHQSNLMPKAA